MRAILAAILTASALLGAGPPAGASYQELRVYRVPLEAIERVDLLPEAYEAPNGIVVTLKDGTALTIEGDNGRALFEDCRDSIETAIGAGPAYLEAVTVVNAQTINGVVTTGCAVLFW